MPKITRKQNSSEAAAKQAPAVEFQIPELVPLCSLSLLLPDGSNHNILSPFKTDGLRRDIKETGFDEPIQVWENPEDGKLYVVNGHKRYAALVDLKAAQALVVHKKFANQKEALAYSIRRNQERGENDSEILSKMVKEFASEFDSLEEMQEALVMTERELFDLSALDSEVKLPPRKKIEGERKVNPSDVVRVQLVLTKPVKALLDLCTRKVVDEELDGEEVSMPHNEALRIILERFREKK